MGGGAQAGASVGRAREAWGSGRKAAADVEWEAGRAHGVGFEAWLRMGGLMMGEGKSFGNGDDVAG